MAARVLLLAVVVLSATAVPDQTYNDFLAVDPEGPSTKGSDFFVAFMPNTRVVIETHPKLLILISTDEPEPVTFTVSLNANLPAAMRVGFPLTARVSYGEVYTVTLHEEMVLSEDVNNADIVMERSKAIRVRTEGGKKITVQGFNDDVRTSDGFVAISCDAMRHEVFNRFEYLVLAADQNPNPDDPPKNSLALIIPCDDDTTIRVEPTQLITVSHLADLSPSAVQVGPEGFSDNVILNGDSGQTILVIHADDLSGTIIRGDKPLVIFSGHQCGEVPLDVTACDHMVEQMPPGPAFGQTFFLVPHGGRVSGDMFRVGTLRDGTELTVTCVTSPTDTPTKLPLDRDGIINRGEVVTFMTPGNFDNQPDYRPSYCCLDATEPIIVAQYSTGYSMDRLLFRKEEFSVREAGDPFMSLVPPVHQFLNNYTMKSVEGASGPFPFRYINLAVASEFFKNSISDQNQVKINESAVVPYNGWIPMYCSSNRICGYGAQVEVSEGTIRVYHERPEVGLFASYYAYQQQNSYGIPLGFELEPLAATRILFPKKQCVREDAGTVVIPLPRYGDLTLQSKLLVSTRSTTPAEATGGVDYVSLTDLAVTYKGGVRQEDLKLITIEIINDRIREPRESFEIVFQATKNVYFPYSVLTVIICDNDGEEFDACICDEEPVKVWFEPSSYVVDETAGIVILTIRTNIPGGPADGVVQFNTADGTATANNDYSSRTYPVQFVAGAFTTTVSVPIIDDTFWEPDEIFYGTLTKIGDENVLITQDTAEVLIKDNDVRVWFDPTSYTVSEGDGVVTLTIKTNAPGGPPPGSVEFYTLDGTAININDYIGVSVDGAIPVVFQTGQFSTTVVVPIVDDEFYEIDEVFFGRLRSTGIATVEITQGSADVLIEDDDARVWFEPTSYIVNEDASTVDLIVRTNIPGGPPSGSVQFLTEDGTAITLEDYIGFSVPLSFESGELVTTITVSIEDDSVWEPDEIFYGRLVNTGIASVNIPHDTATVTILDDDARVWFEPTAYTVNEDAGTVTLTIKTNVPGGPSDGGVEFYTEDGTAIAPGDYGAVSGIPVVFQAGTFTTTVSVPINDDTILENVEIFLGRLRYTGTGSVEITQDEATVTILDNDVVEIGFNPTVYSVNEDSVFVVLNVENRNPAMERDVHVQIATIIGTANTSDFQPENRTLTFSPGDESASVLILIINDEEYEGVEEFYATLTTADSGVRIFAPDATIEIIDDDVRVFFENDHYPVSETAGMVEVCVRREGDTTQSLTIQVSTEDLVPPQALAGSDYVELPGEKQFVTFAANSDRACFSVTILDDQLSEGVEDFLATITSVPSGVDIGNPDTAIISIGDDESLMIDFVVPVYTIPEDEGSVSVCLKTNNGNDEAITVIVSTDHITASNGDYDGTSQVVVIPASPGPSETCFDIGIVDDSIVENNEDFRVSFAIPPGTNAEVGLISSTRVIIVDDDLARIGFNPTAYSVDESSNVVILEIENMTPEMERDVTVQFFSVDGTALDGRDYIGLPESFSHVLTFTPGETKQYVFIPIMDDNVYEGVEEFYGRLTTTDSAVHITYPDATAQITDNDVVEIGFNPIQYTVDESDGIVILYVENRNPEIETEVTVLFDTTDGTAINGEDFYGSATNVTFSPGVTQIPVIVQIVNDAVFEGMEYFFGTLTPVDTRVTIFEPAADVCINDDDVVTVYFESSGYEVVENEGPVTVCVIREGEIAEAIVIQVTTSELSPVQAVAGDDYIHIDRIQLEFTPEQYRACFVVPIIDDEEFEGPVPENFTAIITTVPVGVVVGEPDMPIISIVDNDEPELDLTKSCDDVCTRLNDIDAVLKKLCDKLDIQADQLETLLGLFDPIAK